MLVHLNAKSQPYILTCDHFYHTLSISNVQLSQTWVQSYPELTHEVGQWGDTFFQLGVFLLSQWHSGKPRGTIWSHDAWQAKEHLCTYAAPALKQTEKRGTCNIHYNQWKHPLKYTWCYCLNTQNKSLGFIHQAKGLCVKPCGCGNHTFNRSATYHMMSSELRIML